MMYVILLLLLSSLILASPQRTIARELELGIKFENNDADSLPLLRLPYGTWRAYRYDIENDVGVSLAFMPDDLKFIACLY